MFTDLPNLICKACATVNTNIFFYLALSKILDPLLRSCGNAEPKITVAYANN